MKPREARRKVLIDARLRQDCGWSDARILNLSSRGMMVRASSAPARGTYVEISRGAYRIVARDVWVKGDRFGARSQDRIAFEAIAKGEEDSLRKPANFNNDRRLQRRDLDPEEQHERSRARSRRLELAVVVAFGSAAAGFAFDAVRETLARPLGRVEAVFGAAG